MSKLLSRLSYLMLFGMMACLLTVACNPNHFDHSRSLFQPANDCQTVQHSMGETCVSKTPQRLVALNPAALANAIALGIKPIASVYDSQFPDYLADKIEGIKPLGEWSQPSIERIALLKPDLMIGWQHNHQAIYPQLSAIAPTVFYDWMGGNVREDNWKQYFNFMAEVLNRKKAGEQIWQRYHQRIEQLKTALGDRYKNKTISFIFFCCGGILGENSFASSVLSDVGLQRPPSQQDTSKVSFTFSEEALDVADGDVMFVGVYGGRETGERDFNLLQKKPLWQKLNAVQQNRVYYIDPTVWRGRTPLAADALIDDLYKYLVNTP
ncbi:ABC transporter substrate-binding protein [Myxacorys almedinensis]|uniref:ABC transporter substrate-binding protein n=1 Tax=Myxacorys almedinensis A TaxID=2690445 RepID=A0A8J7Z3Z7_9CYAN|nr:iron-siderophore ABC transporter substrate-binding protein [Myxacorys almedinensis]NDJ17708.1 ABC transporter substrate-binding protein [Myxacorys almedinensis A]